MYNKCDKCGKMIPDADQRKLVMDSKGKVSTRCLPCYDLYLKAKAASGSSNLPKKFPRF